MTHTNFRRHRLSCPSPLQAVAGFALLLITGLASGCKKDEAPPPLPVAPAAEEKEEAPFELKPEDAGAPVAPVPEKKKTTRRRSSSAGSLKKCCDALRQNAANAPEPTRQYMTSAAAACDALAAQGKDKNTAGGMIVGMLKGAGLPAQCK